MSILNEYLKNNQTMDTLRDLGLQIKNKDNYVHISYDRSISNMENNIVNNICRNDFFKTLKKNLIFSFEFLNNDLMICHLIRSKLRATNEFIKLYINKIVLKLISVTKKYKIGFKINAICGEKTRKE